MILDSFGRFRLFSTHLTIKLESLRRFKSCLSINLVSLAFIFSLLKLYYVGWISCSILVLYQSSYFYHNLSYRPLICIRFNALKTSEGPLQLLCFELKLILLFEQTGMLLHFLAPAVNFVWPELHQKSIINSVHVQIEKF